MFYKLDVSFFREDVAHLIQFCRDEQVKSHTLSSRAEALPNTTALSLPKLRSDCQIVC